MAYNKTSLPSMKKKKKKKKKASSSISKSVSKKFNNDGSAGRYKLIICLVLLLFVGATYVNTGGNIQVSLKKRLDDIEKLKQRHTKTINNVLVHAYDDDDEQEELFVVDKTRHDEDNQHVNNANDGSISKSPGRQRGGIVKTLRKRQTNKDVESHSKKLQEIEGNPRSVQKKHDEHMDILKHQYNEHEYTTQAMEIMRNLEKDDTVQNKFVFIAYGHLPQPVNRNC